MAHFTGCERSFDLGQSESPNTIRVTCKRDPQYRAAPLRKLLLMKFFDWVAVEQFVSLVSWLRNIHKTLVYSDVSLKAAREKREAARRQLVHRLDPGEVRKTEKIARAGAETFEAVAREWHAKFSSGWVQKHGERIVRRLENDIFPWLGKRPIGEVKAPETLGVCCRIESRGAVETAHRVLQNCGQVFRYAIATGRAERDPTRGSSWCTPTAERKALSLELALGSWLELLTTNSANDWVRREFGCI